MTLFCLILFILYDTKRKYPASFFIFVHSGLLTSYFTKHWHAMQSRTDEYNGHEAGLNYATLPLNEYKKSTCYFVKRELFLIKVLLNIAIL